MIVSECESLYLSDIVPENGVQYINRSRMTNNLENLFVQNYHIDLIDCGQIDSEEMRDFVYCLLTTYDSLLNIKNPEIINCYIPEYVYNNRRNVTKFDRGCYPSNSEMYRFNESIRI